MSHKTIRQLTAVVRNQRGVGWVGREVADFTRVCSIVKKLVALRERIPGVAVLVVVQRVVDLPGAGIIVAVRIYPPGVVCEVRGDILAMRVTRRTYPGAGQLGWQDVKVAHLYIHLRGQGPAWNPHNIRHVQEGL